MNQLHLDVQYRVCVVLTPFMVPAFFIPWNYLIFPWLPKISPDFFLFFTKTYLFFLNMASIYHWGSVFRNTNLLLTYFPKVKPPYIVILKAKYISTFYLSTHCEKIFLIWKIFPLILAEHPVFPWFPRLEKVFKSFPDSPNRYEPWPLNTKHTLSYSLVRDRYHHGPISREYILFD